jgi:hypothetical protein
MINFAGSLSDLIQISQEKESRLNLINQGGSNRSLKR